MPKKNFYINESEMDDYQRQIINKKSDRSFIVTGCAGSGKSVLALWRYHDIVKKNEGTVQIIVFTTTLKDYFIEGCQGIGLNTDCIFHKKEWEKHPYSSDFILVDEAQDFSEADIRYFMQCANKALLLYGDSSQQLYGWLEKKGEAPRVDMDQIHGITSYPIEPLVFNHRLPKTIAKVAERVMPEEDSLAERCRNEGYKKPFLLKCDSLEKQIEQVGQIIKSRGFQDVGILLPRNEDVERVASMLQKQGLTIEAKYTKNNSTVSNLRFSTSNPKVMTYHSAKGLQFEAVFLPNCHASSLGAFTGPLYVAMTRTYQSLYILYSETLPVQLQPLVNTDLVETSLITRETELL